MKQLNYEKPPGVPYNESHYWVSSFPFFSSTFFFTQNETSNPSIISIFDADGELINQAQVSFAPRTVGILELDEFMGACKVESGLTHAHALIESPEGSSCICRIHTSRGASIAHEMLKVSTGQNSFFPVAFSEKRSSLIAITNWSTSEATIRVRLFCGNRLPETTRIIPPMGSRVISLPAEFPDFLIFEPGKEVRAYVRLSTSSKADLGVQLLERNDLQEGHEVYSMVS